MATRANPATADVSPPESLTQGQLVEYEAFIESQLRKTRSHVRGVDIAAAAMLFVAGSLAFFFAAALLDHWLVSGGLGFWQRSLLLALYVCGATWWIGTEIVPLIVRRINPLYAAFTIERGRPSLKNSLVNFLMFRSNPAGVHQKVLAAIEEQAAQQLAGMHVESAVDRSRLIKFGYVLVGILLICALYAMFSPKSPLQTVGRVMMPWADLAPPTQTKIDEITPGDSRAFRGQQVAVKARVQGLPDEGKVTLYYTTADRQIVDRPVEMSRPADDYRFAATLPAGDSALQQTLSYRIEAGDAVSHTHTITVVAAPTIVVRAIEYKYPDYTGLITQRIEHQGDIKALEGTEVTLEALANQEIASAHVDFGGDAKLDLRMAPEGETARAKFRLALGDDRQTPEHTSYQLVFKNHAGQDNPQPVRHQIQVTRDLAPEIQFVAPSRDEVDVPLDGSVDLEVVATDPDFALASVRIVASRGDEPLFDLKLLDEEYRGQFVDKYRFDPRRLRLAVGDVVDYYAVAIDNKTPRPNQTETSRRRIRIVSPTNAVDEDQLAKNDRPQDGERRRGQEDGQRRQRDERLGQQRPDMDSQPGERDERQSAEEAGEGAGEQQSGEQGRGQGDADQNATQQDGKGREGASQGEQQGGGASEERGTEQQEGDAGGDGEPGLEQTQDEQEADERRPVPSDGTNDGDAFERILKHRRGQEQQDGPSDQQPSEPSRSEQGGEQGTQKKPAQDADQQRQEENASSDKSDQRQQDGQREDGSRQRDQGAQGQQQPQKQQGGDQQRGERQDGQQESGEQKPGQQQGGDDSKQHGEGQQGREKPGESGKQSQRDGSRQQGNEQGNEQGQAGDKQQDQQSGGRQQPGEKGTPGDRSQQQPGSDSGEEQSSDEQSSDEQSSDEQSSDEQGQGDTQKKPGEDGKQQGQRNVDDRQRGEGTDEGDQSSGKGQQPGEKQPGERDPRGGATQDNNTREDGTPQDPMNQGQGGQSKDDPTRNANQKPQQDGDERPDARGGDGQQAKGESGAGEKTDENKGAPQPQDSNKPTNKSQEGGAENQEQRRDGQEQSPSTSKRESDSESSEDGDRSGGGKRGGGQKANKPGTGGAGQNTAADEGAGKSDEAGDGETSDRAGDDRQAEGKTGQSGNQQGKGSQSRSADGQQDQSGGDDAGQGTSDDASTNDGQSQPGDGSQAGPSPSGGRPGERREREWKPGTDSSDEANLEYTREATDLALDHLKDQMQDGEASQQLLDELGWTQQDAERFVRRWESLRKSAQTQGPQGTTARRELDETLRSLGLRPRGSKLDASAGPGDRAQGYRESTRTTPPAEYSEAFKAYTQGTARGGK